MSRFVVFSHGQSGICIEKCFVTDDALLCLHEVHFPIYLESEFFRQAGLREALTISIANLKVAGGESWLN